MLRKKYLLAMLICLDSRGDRRPGVDLGRSLQFLPEKELVPDLEFGVKTRPGAIA